MDYRKRMRRWRFFQVLFAFTCLGILLDVVTTAIWFGRAGSGYEQNPLGKFMIDHLGWVGLGFVLMALCAICYLSVRTVYWRMSTVWSAILNVILLLIAAFRWLVVMAAIIALIHPPT
jgi:hypothetical protein